MSERIIPVTVNVDRDELLEWAGKHADAGHHGVAVAGQQGFAVRPPRTRLVGGEQQRAHLHRVRAGCQQGPYVRASADAAGRDDRHGWVSSAILFACSSVSAPTDRTSSAVADCASSVSAVAGIPATVNVDWCPPAPGPGSIGEATPASSAACA